MTSIPGVDSAVIQAIGDARNLPDVAKRDAAFARAAAQELLGHIDRIVNAHAAEIPPDLASRMREALVQARRLGIENPGLTQRVALLGQRMAPAAPPHPAQDVAHVGLPAQGAEIRRGPPPPRVVSIVPEEHAPPAPAYRFPEAQVFGTDFPHGDTQESIQATLTAALRAGYRTFDMAATYHADGPAALAAACHEAGVDRRELTLVLKVKPELDAKKTTQKIDQLKQRCGFDPDVLMLHEVHGDQSDADTLAAFQTAFRGGRIKAVGLSNVSGPELPLLAGQLAEMGLPLACIQNRCSPYAPDTEVRAWCAEHGARYLGFGLFGSSMMGVCGDTHGQGDPRAYLATRDDPRLQALAGRTGVAANTLLLAWLERQGMSAVSFSKDEAHMRANRGAAANEHIGPDVVRELDAMFGPMPAARRAELAAVPGLRGLYESTDDPTVWHVLDQVTGRTAARPTAKQAAARALLESTAAALPSAPDKQNFCLRLVRHVANLQTLAAQERAENADVVQQPWNEQLCDMLAFVQAHITEPGVRDRFTNWAKQNALTAVRYHDAPAVGGDLVNPRPLPRTGEVYELAVNAGKYIDAQGEMTFFNEDVQPVQPTKDLVCQACRNEKYAKVRVVSADARTVRIIGVAE